MIVLGVVCGCVLIFIIGVNIGWQLNAYMVDKVLEREIRKLADPTEIERLEKLFEQEKERESD